MSQNNNLLLDNINQTIHSLTSEQKFLSGSDFELYVFLSKFAHLLEIGKISSSLNNTELENFITAICNLKSKGD